MKRIFPPVKNKRANSNRIALFFAFLLLLVLLFLLKSRSGFIIELEKPFLTFALKIKNASGFIQEFFRSKSSLIRELETLKNDKTNLENERVRLEESLKITQNSTNFFSSEENHGQAALILKTSLNEPSETLTVDLGEKNGIEIGFKALAYGVYLGEVTETSESTSRISLISSPDQNVSGYLEPEGINIALEGMGGGNIKFTIPKSLNAKVGERIFTNSRSQYLMGQIEYIKEESAQPLEEAWLRIPLNLAGLRFVEITRPI